MGIVTSRDGCVETAVNWEEVYEISLLGIHQDKIPDDMKIYQTG